MIKEERHYPVGDEQYPSVTTIIGILEKYGLYQWHANMGVEYLVKYLTQQANLAGSMGVTLDVLKDLDLELISKEAKAHARKTAREAGDIGKRFHELAHRFLMLETIEQKDIDDDVHDIFMSFTDWCYENKIKPIATEREVFHHKLKYAGRFDLLARINKELFIIDFKTSNRLYPTDKMQIAGYTYAYENGFGKVVDKGGILRLDKETGKHYWYEYTKAEMKYEFRKFKQLVQYWHLMKGGKKWKRKK
jgi:hypothetical protein